MLVAANNGDTSALAIDGSSSAAGGDAVIGADKLAADEEALAWVGFGMMVSIPLCVELHDIACP